MKTIKMKSNGVGRYDDVSPFMVADNELELKIELPNFNGEFFLVAENNGVTVKRSVPQDGVLTLGGLTAGELNAEVKHYLKGTLIRVYKIEPLLLKEVDGTLSAMPEIADLRREIAGIVKGFNEYKESVLSAFNAVKDDIALYRARLEEQICDVERNTAALIRFACDDYTSNVYLGGGTVEEFKEKYGLNPTDFKIKGDEEND